jgi:hypothetical protein
MKITLTDESTGQEIIPIDCEIKEDDQKNTMMVIKNQKLVKLMINDILSKKEIVLYRSSFMCYFLYNNKKYLTDKYLSITQNVKKHGEKSFYVTFQNEKGEMQKEYITYNI